MCVETNAKVGTLAHDFTKCWPIFDTHRMRTNSELLFVTVK